MASALLGGPFGGMSRRAEHALPSPLKSAITRPCIHHALDPRCYPESVALINYGGGDRSSPASPCSIFDSTAPPHHRRHRPTALNLQQRPVPPRWLPLNVGAGMEDVGMFFC